MNGKRARILLFMIALLWAFAALIAINGPRPLQVAGVPPELRVTVSPNAILTSGSWLVTACLHYLENDTCWAVDATVMMYILLSDRSSFVQTKNTSEGQATFQIPARVLGVRFEATYQDSMCVYRGFVNVSGPTVIPEGLGWGLLLSSVTAGFAYLSAASGDLLNIRTIGHRRRMLVAGGFCGAVIPPCAYIVAEVPFMVWLWLASGLVEWNPALVSAPAVRFYLCSCSHSACPERFGPSSKEKAVEDYVRTAIVASMVRRPAIPAQPRNQWRS